MAGINNNPTPYHYGRYNVTGSGGVTGTPGITGTAGITGTPSATNLPTGTVDAFADLNTLATMNKANVVATPTGTATVVTLTSCAPDDVEARIDEIMCELDEVNKALESYREKCRSAYDEIVKDAYDAWQKASREYRKTSMFIGGLDIDARLKYNKLQNLEEKYNEALAKYNSTVASYQSEIDRLEQKYAALMNELDSFYNSDNTPTIGVTGTPTTTSYVDSIQTQTTLAPPQEPTRTPGC